MNDSNPLTVKNIPIIEMKGIYKRFPGVLANENVDFKVYKSEIHALLGEMVPEKALMKSVWFLQDRPGKHLFKGIKSHKISRETPRVDFRDGIPGFEFIPAMTVLEYTLYFWKIFRDLQSDHSAEKNQRFIYTIGLSVSQTSGFPIYSIGEQQKVEILNCSFGFPCLILDEADTGSSSTWGWGIIKCKLQWNKRVCHCFDCT